MLQFSRYASPWEGEGIMIDHSYQAVFILFVMVIAVDLKKDN